MDVKIHNSTFESWLLPSEIAEAVSIIAQQIRKEFPTERLVLMCVMKGSIVFFADLLRQLEGEVEMGFVSASSYRGTASTGIVQIHARSEIALKGKVCILVEDIVDTGQTIQAIRDILSLEKPKSLKVATLLYKRETFLGGDEPDYVGIEIPNEFVVGYGLDFDELGRNLEGIYKLKR
ncbi:MAG: hypoxanthine phosphoribosyltransferase [Bacteroidia bacterium]|jgi:hypoxanthine phosphoribosyltransferase